MKINQGHIPQIADLVPYNIRTSQCIEVNSNELASFKKLVATKKMDFVAISGQHSSKAAKQLLAESAGDEKVREAAERLKFRQSRILSWKTPVDELAAHSLQANAINVTTKFTSSYMDTISHAHRQYKMVNSPPLPDKGDVGNNDRNYRVSLILIRRPLCYIRKFPTLICGRYDIDSNLKIQVTVNIVSTVMTISRLFLTRSISYQPLTVRQNVSLLRFSCLSGIRGACEDDPW